MKTNMTLDSKERNCSSYYQFSNSKYIFLNLLYNLPPRHLIVLPFCTWFRRRWERWALAALGTTLQLYWIWLKGLHYITYYLADPFFLSDVQNSAYQGHIINNRTRQVKYNSYWIGCPVHKVDRPSQTTKPRPRLLSELQRRDEYKFKSLIRYKVQGAKDRQGRRKPGLRERSIM